MTSEAVKQATFIVCPLCDKRECVGRHDCKEIAEYVKRKEQGVATEKRLIDANALVDEWNTLIKKMRKDSDGAYPVDFAVVIREVSKAATVEAVEVVHSRFVRIADFGDGEGCFGYCEKCGTVHHAQSPVALKADHRWCRWCGAKMDGDTE